MKLVIEGCAIATVDAAGTEHADGHIVIEDDRIVDYRLRQPDQKQCSVKAFQALEYKVVAAGDSYNDTTMLSAADAGFLFRAPENVIAEFPQFPAMTGYDELLEAITAEL